MINSCQIEFAIDPTLVDYYELDVLRSGRCLALVPGSYFSEEKEIHVIYDIEGCEPFARHLEMQPGGILSGYKNFLKQMRMLCQSLDQANSYFIATQSISLKLEDIYVKNGKVCLLIKPSEDGFHSRIISLCEEIYEAFPDTNADSIVRKLSKEYAGGLSPRRLERILNLCELELA